MSYTRIHRLLKIISLIQAGRGWNAKRLAKECETAERTIYRDLKELQAAGVPVSFDRSRNGYAVAGHFFMPPVHLTLEESLALAALCEHISEKEQIPFMRPAVKALHKIESQLPAGIREELAERVRALTIQTGPAMPPDGYADVYDRVQQAIAAQRTLRCRYESVRAIDHDGEEDGKFEFQPYALLFSVRAWYAIGRRSDRKGLRTLKLSRFTHIELTDRGYDVPSSFSVNKYLGNAWRLIKDGKDVEVEIWFDPKFAQTVSDTLWHRTQQIEWHRDNSCTFRCRVSGLSEIEWWVLSMGPHCRVKKPRALADRVCTLASETASRYTAAASRQKN